MCSSQFGICFEAGVMLVAPDSFHGFLARSGEERRNFPRMGEKRKEKKGAALLSLRGDPLERNGVHRSDVLLFCGVFKPFRFFWIRSAAAGKLNDG